MILYGVSHQLCPFKTALESTQKMLRFEHFFDFWKISINSTSWVKKVLEDSRKWKIFSNVPKNYPESTFDFFWILTEWWFWHENPQWGNFLLFYFASLRVFMLKSSLSQIPKKVKSGFWIIFWYIRKKFSFSGIFQNSLHPAGGIDWNFSEIKKFLKRSIFWVLSEAVSKGHNWWDTLYIGP